MNKKNVTFTLNPISAFLFKDRFTSGTLIEEPFDVYFMPVELFDISKMPNTSFSTSLGYSNIKIVSGPPILTEKTVFTSFVIFDTEVVIVILLLVVAFSCFMAFTKELYNRNKITPITLFSKVKFWMWKFFCTFFNNPLPSLSLHKTSLRLGTVFWMILVLFTIILTGSFLNSNFSSLVYLKIDQLKDIEYYPNSKPTLIFNSDTLTAFLKTQSHSISKLSMASLTEKKTDEEVFDVFSEDYYVEISQRKKIVITTNVVFEILFCMATKYSQPAYNQELYLSKQDLLSKTVSFIFTSNIPKEIREEIDLRLMVQIESRPFENVIKSCRARIDSITWRQPMEEKYPVMTLSDFNGIIVLLGIGWGSGFVILILEYIYFYKVAKISQNKPNGIMIAWLDQNQV